MLDSQMLESRLWLVLIGESVFGLCIVNSEF
jgi:hypothetical protein